MFDTQANLKNICDYMASSAHGLIATTRDFREHSVLKCSALNASSGGFRIIQNSGSAASVNTGSTE